MSSYVAAKVPLAARNETKTPPWLTFFDLQRSFATSKLFVERANTFFFGGGERNRNFWKTFNSRDRRRKTFWCNAAAMLAPLIYARKLFFEQIQIWVVAVPCHRRCCCCCCSRLHCSYDSWWLLSFHSLSNAFTHTNTHARTNTHTNMHTGTLTHALALAPSQPLTTISPSCTAVIESTCFGTFYFQVTCDSFYLAFYFGEGWFD